MDDIRALFADQAILYHPSANPTKILLRQSGEKELPKHPYLNYKQRTQIERLLRYNGYVSSGNSSLRAAFSTKTTAYA